MGVECPKCKTENTSDSEFCKKCATPLPYSKEIPVTETLETPTEELTRGTIFADRYEIIEELGKGGMGKVYRVEDKKIKEEVALKLIKPEIASDKKTIARFSNELKMARKIAHRNVCKMYDLGEEKGTHYITMEYVPGEDLKSFIRRAGLLSAGKAVFIAKQVVEGLTEAHRLGVIHRDLKPQNIMIDEEGNARIMDFGIARAARGKGITAAGVIVGTPEYMSPEQAEVKEVDQRSDIYSLGVILYEMVTGRIPFEGETALGIAMKHKSEAPQDPRELNAQIPEDLSRVILRCMEKDREKRYQNAGEVRSELSGIERGLPSAPRVIPERTPKPSREIKGTFRKRWVTITIPMVVVILVGLAILYIAKEKPVPPSETKKLVVLPFENLGPSEDEYFADGITDAVTARLARLRNLGVISRQSAVQYKNSTKSPQEISKELGGVQYILEGTVQRERPSDPTSRVRIIPQLIDVSDNTHMWAETYDDEFSEVFRVQSDIAERVAKALEVVLLEPERQSLTTRPTDNPEAYELYLRAGKYRYSYSNENQIAVELLERAVGADPEFALAYVRLSRFHSLAFFLFDRAEKRKTKAKEYADRALLLDPELPDAHFALGKYYYECLLDYERALEEFAIAGQGLPNDAPLLMAEAFIWRRQGKVAEAAENFKKAFTLDPRSSSAAEHLAITLSGMRSYAEAEMYFDRAIALAPDSPNPYSFQAWNYLAWRGDTQQARAVLERMPEGIDPRGFYVLTWSEILRIERNYEEALSWLLDSPVEILSYQNFFFPKSQLLAEVRQAIGDSLQARADYDSARKILEQEMAERPDDPRLHISLGLVFAGLGRKQDAIREGRLAVELVPVSKDYFVGQYFSEYLARIYTMIGEHEEAIGQLEYLLSVSTGMVISPALLRADPRWDPLRGNSRFKKLLRE